DLLHPFKGVLQQIRQLGFPVLQGPLDFLTFRDLALERLRLLLQERDGAQARAILAQRRVTLSRDDVRVCVADLLQRLAISCPVKQAQRVGALEMERVRPGQVVPEMFELDGSLRLTLCPQQRDHFPENGYL